MPIGGATLRINAQRIYGTAFEKKADLDAYLTMLEEAAKRDHRKIGRELDLFSLQDEGPGFPFFHPKGMVLRNELESFWRKLHVKYGYQEIKTPIILNQELWKQSGHWEHYRDNMYFTTIDGEGYAVKPMNCPAVSWYIVPVIIVIAIFHYVPVNLVWCIVMKFRGVAWVNAGTEFHPR